MRIVFMGTPTFSVPSLNALIGSEHELLCVITQPDRPKGRGMRLAMPPVKATAIKHGISVLQPENVNDKQIKDHLKRLNPQLIVVVAYGQKLSKRILSTPTHGCINLHASLLPKYRGAAPIPWTILNGEIETGVTAIKLTSKMDAGPIIGQCSTGIAPTETAGELHDRLSLMAAELLMEVISALEKGEVSPREQNEEEATIALMLHKKDGNINWDQDCKRINNLIRAMTPWPGAFTFHCRQDQNIHRRIVILEAEPKPSAYDTKEHEPAPGTVKAVREEGILVAARNGDILVKRLQPENGRAMSASDYIHGHKTEIGDTFGILSE